MCVSFYCVFSVSSHRSVWKCNDYRKRLKSLQTSTSVDKVNCDGKIICVLHKIAFRHVCMIREEQLHKFISIQSLDIGKKWHIHHTHIYMKIEKVREREEYVAIALLTYFVLHCVLSNKRIYINRHETVRIINNWKTKFSIVHIFLAAFVKF